MSTFKRFLSTLLSILLVFSVITVTGITTLASDDVTVTVKSAQNIFEDVTRTYKRNDTFEFTVLWQNTDLLRAGLFETHFNANSLRITDQEINPVLNPIISNISPEVQEKDNLVTANFSTANGVDFSTESLLIKYKFTVQTTASSTETIVFDIEDIYGNPADNILNYIDFIYNHQSIEENADKFSATIVLGDGVPADTTPSDSSNPIESDSSAPSDSSNPNESDSSTPSESSNPNESDSSAPSDSSNPDESDSSAPSDSSNPNESDSSTPSDSSNSTDPTESDSNPTGSTGTTGTSGNESEGKTYIVNTGNYKNLTVIIYDILDQSQKPFKTIECVFDENNVCDFYINLEMKFTIYSGSKLLFSSYFKPIVGKYISTGTFGIYNTLEEAQNAQPIVTEPTESVKPTTPKKPAFNVTKKTLKAGQKYTLKVVNANGKKATKFQSSKTKVATVSSKGVVTALGSGKTTITATVGSTKIKCTITVSSSPKVYNGKKAVKNNKIIKVKKGKTLKLTIKGKASGVNNSYKTSNKKIAKVTSKKSATKIKIKAYKKGSAKVTITVNKKYKTTIKVKVI